MNVLPQLRSMEGVVFGFLQLWLQGPQNGSLSMDLCWGKSSSQQVAFPKEDLWVGSSSQISTQLSSWKEGRMETQKWCPQGAFASFPAFERKRAGC